MTIDMGTSLKSLNTFGIEHSSQYYTEINGVEDLKILFKEKELNKNLLVLGGGSNVLLTKDFEGLTIKNNILGKEVIKETDRAIYIKCGSGMVWHDFVLFCIENNWGGVENLSLIPGSVGAAPMQNIGAYGVELKDIFYELEAFDIKNGTTKVFSNDDCKFGYRESVFKTTLKGKYIITSVTFQLNKEPQVNTSYGAIEGRLQEMKVLTPTIKNVSDAVIHIRKSKLPDPSEIGNAGSFFKNPVISNQDFELLKKKFPDIVGYPNGDQTKVAAGWLIEQAGWKGKTRNNYGVHKNQALVLVNYGGALGKDIFALSEEILISIKEKFGIHLEREVNII